jgi:GDP/UDP-N,N'-diacetylbacillosamine 2-epimerase (hydrolysing)
MSLSKTPVEHRKICVITGSRAEYGLLRWLLQGIEEEPALELQLIVTGSHLSPEFGLTYKEIEKDFDICLSLEILTSSDTSVGIATSMGLGLIRFADAFKQIKPDLVLVLGDRYEIFSATAASLVARIPVAHLHGGETTEGAFDEALRHSITKMSHLHFVAAEEYKNRVIQLGEQPENVFQVGGLGVDSLKRLKLLSKEELEASLGIKLLDKNLLITFHPVTLETETASQQMNELLGALSELHNTNLIFTLPNADPDGRVLIQLIQEFCSTTINAQFFTSLGQMRYFSAINYFDGVIGNSSSGLTEVPSFKKATINIGDRQKGRLKAGSVIDCEPTKMSIKKAISELYSEEFQKQLSSTINPYGDGGSVEKIIEVLKTVSLENLIKKEFFNIKIN